MNGTVGCGGRGESSKRGDRILGCMTDGKVNWRKAFWFWDLKNEHCCWTGEVNRSLQVNGPAHAAMLSTLVELEEGQKGSKSWMRGSSRGLCREGQRPDMRGHVEEFVLSLKSIRNPMKSFNWEGGQWQHGQICIWKDSSPYWEHSKKASRKIHRGHRKIHRGLGGI